MKKNYAILFVVFFAFGISFSGVAYAHATPIEYSPLASSVTEAAPSEISIKFSEHVEPTASSISVFSSSGEVLNLPTAKVDPKDSRIFRLPFTTNLKGSFTVSWH